MSPSLLFLISIHCARGLQSISGVLIAPSAAYNSRFLQSLLLEVNEDCHGCFAPR